MDKKLIDPLEIETDFPIITLVSHNNKIVSWLIRVFSKGSYNHCCWLYRPRMVASQDGSYKERRLTDYMKKGYKLKFYKLIDIIPYTRELLLTSISDKLAKGKIKTRYDWLGVVSQIIPSLRFLNIPYLNYCSESVNEDLMKVYPNVPFKPSPEGINTYCKENTDKFEYLGHWIAE